MQRHWCRTSWRMRRSPRRQHRLLARLSHWRQCRCCRWRGNSFRSRSSARLLRSNPGHWQLPWCRKRSNRPDCSSTTMRPTLHSRSRSLLRPVPLRSRICRSRSTRHSLPSNRNRRPPRWHPTQPRLCQVQRHYSNLSPGPNPPMQSKNYRSNWNPTRWRSPGYRQPVRLPRRQEKPRRLRQRNPARRARSSCFRQRPHRRRLPSRLHRSPSRLRS